VFGFVVGLVVVFNFLAEVAGDFLGVVVAVWVTVIVSVR